MVVGRVAEMEEGWGAVAKVAALAEAKVVAETEAVWAVARAVVRVVVE